jgi:phosphoribosylaminoimidazolecarboxamide formyltransferase/IMP cyclohydrolase
MRITAPAMIRRALLSVSDKNGLLPFAKRLSEKGVEILSTGGTFRALTAAEIPVVSVESYTGSPEVMDGRVKTLHPRVHGGILMRGEQDLPDLERIGAKPIDLVVVNLYPFEATVAKEGASHPEIIENIDIGGPSMVRSAAKNHDRVAIVCDPADYSSVLEEIERTDGVSLETRKRLAAKAFAHTAGYDAAIAKYLSQAAAPTAEEYAPFLSLSFEKVYGLRYGENPHQSGAFYRQRGAKPGSRSPRVSVRGARSSASTTSWTSRRRWRPCVNSTSRRRWS